MKSGAPSAARLRRQRSFGKNEMDSSESVSTGERKQAPSVSSEITESERIFLSSILGKHFLFQSLTDIERAALVSSFHKIPCAKSRIVFKQGDIGDGFYVIQEGSYSVSINTTVPATAAGAPATPTTRVIKTLNKSDTFGELALLYGGRRTATVVCASAGVLWKIEAEQFKQELQFLSSKNEDRIMQFLSSEKAYQGIPQSERKLLASLLTVEDLNKDDQLFHIGEVSTWIRIVASGKVQVNKTSFDRGVILGGTSVFFGSTIPNETSKTAVGHVVCFSLSKANMEKLPPTTVRVLRNLSFKTELRKQEILSNLEDDQIDYLASTMSELDLKQRETIWRRGDVPMMLLSFSVPFTLIKSPKGNPEAVPPKSLLIGDGADLDAVVAESAGKFYQISLPQVLTKFEAGNFNEVVKMVQIKEAVKRIFLFKSLNKIQFNKMIKAFTSKIFPENSTICKQGDSATHLYVIVSGNVDIQVNGVHVRTLGKWDYFGERGLLLHETRSATCVAQDGPVECLLLDSLAFRTIVGAFQTMLEERISIQDDGISLNDLEPDNVVGQGGFGTVFLAKNRKDPSKKYALKQVRKDAIVQRKMVSSLLIEREVLMQCNHPCVVQCVKTFKDKDHIYFLTEFLAGGDMFHAMREIGALTNQQSRFFAAAIFSAIEYLHELGWIYRDLKPEQVMLDDRGNVKLVDMGISKKANRTFSLIGTPEYLAPEVIKGKGYGKEIDYWAFGVVLYEMICGPLPFEGEDQIQLFKKILRDPVVFPDYVEDKEGIAIMTKLLDKNPETRMNCQEVKAHPFFDKFDWDGLLSRTLMPPFKPDSNALRKKWRKPTATEAIGKPVSSNDWDKDF
jgi:cGMP-dependent protein kinase 1